MAATYAIAQPQYQSPQAVAQPPQATQGGGQALPDDPLFTALQKYITTGPDATNITTTELRKLYDDNTADSASKVHLEKFIINTPEIPFATWENGAQMSGIVSLTKTKLSFNLNAPSLSVATTGEGAGLYVPSDTTVIGQLWYNTFDNLAPGAGTFVVNVKGLTVYINFYRNQEWVANFTAYPISFTMAPGAKNGSNVWS
ncbi:hypothetical protein MMC11_002766 [Xylographa trunciseda]|nr:hypothetical protein [Xylographa trunciseda]